jgi:hypothetical protein
MAAFAKKTGSGNDYVRSAQRNHGLNAYLD